VGIDVYWDNAEKTILHQDYGATWGWQDYEAAFAQVHQFAGEIDHPFGIIADVGLVSSIPPDAIKHGSRAVRELPDNVSLCVVVTPSRLTMMLLQVIRAATRYEKIRIASSVEEARHLIEAKIDVSNPKPTAP
jgi:hypothetical protein